MIPAVIIPFRTDPSLLARVSPTPTGAMVAYLRRSPLDVRGARAANLPPDRRVDKLIAIQRFAEPYHVVRDRIADLIA